MACEAKTYNDGSWVCWACDIGGDADERPEDFCKAKERERAEKDDKPSKRR